jgi:hypothetical protein
MFYLVVWNDKCTLDIRYAGKFFPQFLRSLFIKRRIVQEEIIRLPVERNNEMVLLFIFEDVELPSAAGFFMEMAGDRLPLFGAVLKKQQILFSGKTETQLFIDPVAEAVVFFSRNDPEGGEIRMGRDGESDFFQFFQLVSAAI